MNAERDTDLLLWRVPAAGAGEPPRVLIESSLQPSRVAWNRGQSLLYVYVPLAQRESIDADRLAALASACLVDGQPAAAGTLSRLERVQDLPGASPLETAHAHYVVETDADAGWMDEIARWYQQEHLPALAAVPGCIRATRFVNHDSGPASLACYDLCSAAVVETPAWLAVRGSAWSARTRPHFTNTRRTMFDVAGP